MTLTARSAAFLFVKIFMYGINNNQLPVSAGIRRREIHGGNEACPPVLADKESDLFRTVSDPGGLNGWFRLCHDVFRRSHRRVRI